MIKDDAPIRTQRYSGFATDSTRWDDFRHRDDDIFICTPCKCGTTWTQALCALLIFKNPEHKKKTCNDFSVGGRSPHASRIDERNASLPKSPKIYENSYALLKF